MQLLRKCVCALEKKDQKMDTVIIKKKKKRIFSLPCKSSFSRSSCPPSSQLGLESLAAQRKNSIIYNIAANALRRVHKVLGFREEGGVCYQCVSRSLFRSHRTKGPLALADEKSSNLLSPLARKRPFDQCRRRRRYATFAICDSLNVPSCAVVPGVLGCKYFTRSIPFGDRHLPARDRQQMVTKKPLYTALGERY